jgi:hypothetical protein
VIKTVKGLHFLKSVYKKRHNIETVTLLFRLETALFDAKKIGAAIFVDKIGGTINTSSAGSCKINP